MYLTQVTKEPPTSSTMQACMAIVMLAFKISLCARAGILAKGLLHAVLPHRQVQQQRVPAVQQVQVGWVRIAVALFCTA